MFKTRIGLQSLTCEGGVRIRDAGLTASKAEGAHWKALLLAAAHSVDAHRFQRGELNSSAVFGWH
jgi:hypothetical protein